MNHKKSSTVLCVINGLGEYVYKGSNFDFVVPIGCLKY